MARQNTFEKLPGDPGEQLRDMRQRNYSPELMRQFVNGYRTVARGFADALYIRGLAWRCFWWCCPGCDRTHREDHDDVPDDAEFMCWKCGWSGSGDDLRLGRKVEC